MTKDLVQYLDDRIKIEAAHDGDIVELTMGRAKAILDALRAAPASVTRLPVNGSLIAPISDRVDALVRELQRQGMRTLRGSFDGMSVRIDPEPENNNG